ncbi:MAG TPA: type I glyceraldehyde-3-phosphate dehydrogenase [Jatrophihabitans sp.]|nr:type I glyceraldehyde-3-phosphate dehydrogenase [Jatrophihabitans sp.]
MTIRVGINGMGRIGRDYLRLSLETDDLEVVAVNDVLEPEMLAHLLRYDSSFGPLAYDVEADAAGLLVNGRKLAMSSEHDPMQLDWGAAGADVVIEATGRFRSRETAGTHLLRGAPRVLLSAPGKQVDATIVMGVNDDSYQPDRHYVISNASCTTNCAAPMVKVLHEAFGIERGFLTTVHAYTNDQNLLDGPHKDPRRARSAAVNIVPTSTGAARAVGGVIPDLAGRLDGIALRVPVVDGSLVDLAVLLEVEVTADRVNEAFEVAAETGSLAGRLRYTDLPVVSSDVIGDDSSCLFDSQLTQAAGRFVKAFGWYDNEWGYTNRLADLTRLVAA